MAGKPKYNHELIIKLLNERVPIKYISQRIGCSVGAVRSVKLKIDNPEKYVKIYKDYWLKIRDTKNKKPEDRWKKTKPRIGNYEEIVLKYTQGSKISEIAKEYNCHNSTIRKIVRKYE